MLFVFEQPLLEAFGIRELPILNSVIKFVVNTLCQSQNPSEEICYALLKLYYIGEVRKPHDPVRFQL